MVMAYIGDLDDPRFCWDYGDYDGNIPCQIGPEFPIGHKAWHLIIDKIIKGEFEGKKVDWGAFVAKVNKAQIISFTNELYENNNLDMFNDFIKEFKDYIVGLEEGKLYGLVACELY